MSLIDRALACAARAPHQFTVQYPPSRDYFRAHFRATVDRAAFAAARLLYVHVPFCEARCAYCNFAVDVRDDSARRASYVDGLLAALEDVPSHVGADGVDVGGGTPTLLAPDELRRLFGALSRRSTQISTETTPAIAASRPEVLAALREGGVTRLSIGVQSTDAALLGALGREASSLDRALTHARDVGFARVSTDLVFGLPGQSLDDFSCDLDAVVAREPDAITTYDCLYRGKGRRLDGAPPPPEVLGAFYDLAHARLVAAGYRAPYGSLNFSRHPGETGTSAYFERRVRDGEAYLGIGDYASSHAADSWAFSARGVEAWLADPRGHADGYALDRAETMAKHLLLTLGFGRIDHARFERRFGEPLSTRHGEALARACREGWLSEDPEGYAVRDFAALPWIRALFHPERAIAWLERRASRMLTAWNTRTSRASAPASVPSASATSPASGRSSART